MKKNRMPVKFLFYLVFFFIGIVVSAQINTEPALSVASHKVTVTFDSSKESQLGYYTGDLYAHTGVNIEGKGNWQNIIGSWGDNAKQPKLIHKGNGIYELDITPDINTFYSVNSGEKVVQMAFVFRSADGKKQTDDLFVNIKPHYLKIFKS